MPVWEPLLIYALGTLWYGLFNWFWFWIWREQPLRESLSLLYRELADYCEAKYSLLTQHTDPEKRCRRCWCASKSGRSNYPVLSANAYAFRANNTDYKRMLRISRRRWIYRNIFRSVCISRKRCKSWSSVAMRKKLSAGMRKPSPLACACWLMTFFTIACQRVLRWKSKLAHWKNRPPASG